VVCESLPCKPLGNSLWEIAGFGQADIAGHWNVSVVEIYKWFIIRESKVIRLQNVLNAGLGDMPGSRDAYCQGCGYKDPCCD